MRTAKDTGYTMRQFKLTLDYAEPVHVAQAAHEMRKHYWEAVRSLSLLPTGVVQVVITVQAEGECNALHDLRKGLPKR